MRGYMGGQNNPRLTRGAPPPMIWRVMSGLGRTRDMSGPGDK
jgi:hypothetical protein